MQKQIEKRILKFVDEFYPTRSEMTHGTLYIKFDQDSDCDFFHKKLRTFYREFINPQGGVNMYFVGDEFAFDFVPEDREAPVFMKEDEALQDEIDRLNGTNELDEDDLIEAQAEIQMQLEADAKEGK